MRIDNVKVYDLVESIVASGLPMQAEYSQEQFEIEVESIHQRVNRKPIDRAYRLASNPASSGHCNFLTGIRVSFNVTATNAWLLQAERYHFLDIISCQSKMHRLKNMDMEQCCNEKVSIGIIEQFEDSKHLVNDDIESLIYNCPMGLELTCRMSTNYLQLKTIYIQRHNHRLTEWRDFCNWIESLPFAKELIIGETNEAN